MRGRLLAVLVAAGMIALLAGCGGDDAPIEPIGTAPEAETGGARPAISRGEFIERADRRCAEANVAIANLTQGTAAESLVTAAGQERQITDGMLDALRNLNPRRNPALNRFFGGLEDQVSVLSDRAEAARGGDTESYEALGGQLAQAKADARAAAEEYGFERCGQEGSPLDPAEPGVPGDAIPGEEAPPADPAPQPQPEPAPEPAPPTGGVGPDSGGGGGVSPP